MMFARSLLDENPIYNDADYAAKSETGNVIAPPTFGRSVAQFDPNYHLRLKTGEKWFGRTISHQFSSAGDSSDRIAPRSDRRSAGQ